MTTAYELACETPMTAPVARFSLRIPVVEVMIIRKDVRVMEREIARSIPIIIGPVEGSPWPCTPLILILKNMFSYY